MSERLLPASVGPNAEFYAYLARGELRLQRCTECGAWRHPPRHRCATCGATTVAWERVSGRGRLFSWTVTHRPVDPAFMPPYAVVVVELDEGPRLMTNIIDCPQTPEALQLDMPVEVAFEKLDDEITLPLFRPARG
jgi:uncharacterized OB-fold protein